jgi:hypothetical protein
MVYKNNMKMVKKMNMKNNMKKTLVLPLVIVIIATATVGTASVLTSNEKGRYLSIETPYEVWEGQSFRIQVLEYGDDIIYNLPVENATVSWLKQDYLTNSTGFVTLQAPFVDFNTSISFRVSKIGYRDLNDHILVKDGSAPLAHTTPQITENRVIDNECTQGTTEATIPAVTPKIVNDVPADVDGSQEVSIASQTQTTPLFLLMKIFPSITLDEGSSFIVKITCNEKPVGSAMVSFFNQIYSTNDDGIVSIVAPFVDVDTSLYIVAQKDGYQENGYYVLIRDIYQPHHPVDANGDLRISISELTAYAAAHGNDFNILTGTDIWRNGEIYNCNNYVNNWNPYHPADTNKDFNIHIEERTSYAAAHGASDPDVQSATLLWQHGESYYWDYSSHNWMPVF